MSNREVFESRNQINAVLISNLIEYGNIEPPGLYGRAYNDGIQTKYQFSAANYLRIAAAQRDNKRQDLRWFSDQAIEEKKYALKVGAKPVEIEYWKGTDDGQSYEGHLRKFYNADDVIEMNGTRKIVRGNEEADLEYAQELLHSNGFGNCIDLSRDKLFPAVQEYAVKKGADEFAAPMASQLFFKTSHLYYDYAEHPLYTEKQIDKLAKNPKILFCAMKKAQELVCGMQQAHDIELKRIAEKMNKERKQPFKDLTVDFFWSERCIKDIKGKEYQEGQQLRGEEAYRFLVQLNAADKEQFDSKLQGFGNYDKTKLAICYGNYDHGKMRVDLGDLELCNKSSIAEALVVRFNAYRNYLMTNEQAMNSYIGVQNAQGKEVDRDHVIVECKSENAECEKAMRRFAEEEKQYLDNNPEIKLINERKADAFLYYCTETEFSKVPADMVLAVHKVSEYDGLALSSYDSRGNLNRPWKEAGVEGVVFESAASNEAIKKGLSIQVALTKEDQIAIRNLEKFSVRLENYGAVMEQLEEPVIQEMNGAQAVQRFIQEKKHEVDVMKNMQYEQKIMRQSQQQMTFSYQGEEFYKLKYEIGSGTLNESIPTGLPLYNEENNKLNQELQQAVYTHMKHRGLYQENGMHDLNQKNRIRLPYPEVVRAKIKENKPTVNSHNTKQFAYYAELATSDFKIDASEKVLKAMVQEMKRDGLTDVKIANVIKSNARFCLHLTDSKRNEKLPKVKKRKLQVVPEKKGDLSYEMSRPGRRL